MDEKTRGFIEKGIDHIIQEEVFRYVEWIRHEIPISKLGEVMIGYLVGTIEAFAEACLVMAKIEVTEKEDEEIRTIIKRRLPEIVEKIERELGR